ncbi:MAG: FkbM family methyltransferase [Acidimicrobiia bacterium]
MSEDNLPNRLALLIIGVAGWVLAPVSHRGYWRVCRQVAARLPNESVGIDLSLGGASRMKVLLNDPYWSRLVSPFYRYEPELLNILRRSEELDYAFLDCGANFGYWSILVSDPEGLNRPTAAIEASPRTFKILIENADLNGNRFPCLNNAIAGESGRLVRIIDRGDHAAAKIGAQSDPYAIAPAVETLTIADAVRRVFSKRLHGRAKPLPRRLVVKLDVEGHEIPALQGSAGFLFQERDTLLYYEDQRKDRKSRVTDFVLNTLGLKVFFVRGDRDPIPIVEVEMANNLKERRQPYGYNFFACRQDSAFYAHLAGTRR